MHYQAELDFLMETLTRCRLQVQVLDPHSPQTQFHQLDLGLRRLLGVKQEFTSLIRDILRQIHPATIYKVTDPFLCTYIFLQLPNRTQLLMIGPYQTVELTHEQLLELAEQLGIRPQQVLHLQKYYGSLPVLSSENALHAMLDAFGSRLWGKDSFTMQDVNQELYVDPLPLSAREEGVKPEETAWNMQIMEQRYAYENELMQAVSQGLTHKAELIFSGISSMSFERRLADPVRNLKNYCIIMNTLLRKAAERGGVHPIYLDRTSSSFAHRIERLNSTAAVSALMDELFHSYCRLVNRHSTKKYSSPVQKTIIQIDNDLGGSLSLKSLAALQNLNASYLSTLFKKETGQTITDYITQKRIQQAMRLLSTTNLQVQTIAQHCGIMDVNYFSKLFKRHTGKTPNEFRKELRIQVSGT